MLAFLRLAPAPGREKGSSNLRSGYPPGMNEFEQGKTETFQPMFSFDFSLREDQKQ